MRLENGPAEDGNLSKSRAIYPGYGGTAGVGGVIVGTLYGVVDGAVGGAIFAWLYNAVSGSGTDVGNP